MRFLFIAPLLAALPGVAHAKALTFDEALAHAAANAPSLKARLLDVDARRSAATAAGQLPDPRLGVSLENFPLSGPPALSYAEDSMTMTRVGISQDVPNLAKRRAARQRAMADIGASEAQAAVEQRRVKVATALAWLDLAYATRRLAALDGVLDRLRELAPAAVSGVASGSARPAQALDVRQTIAGIEDKRSAVAADILRAQATLARWTGDTEPEIAGDLPAFTIDQAALRAAIGRHPDLVAALARTNRADADLAAARAEKRPDLSFEFGYGRRAERYGDLVSAGVIVSLPLFARKWQDPMIAASTASAGAARFEQDDMRRALVADLEAGLADHGMHHEQWVRARDTLLPLARQRADLEIISYSAGRAALPDLFAAQTAFADASLEVLDREAVVAREAARLVLTYGSDNR